MKTEMDVKVCPFCGHDEISMIIEGENHIVTCDECFARGPVSDSESDAEVGWNKRTNRQD